MENLAPAAGQEIAMPLLPDTAERVGRPARGGAESGPGEPGCQER